MKARRDKSQTIQDNSPNSKDKLRVFISSKMAELRDVREIVGRALDERGIDAWVYETDAGARPEGIEEISLKEVAASDIYVGLFWEKYGDVTIAEYRHAQKLDKPCLVYIRDKNIKRQEQLEEFLRSEVYDLSRGVGYSFFDSAINLGAQIGNDIMGWLVRRLRIVTEEIQTARVSKAEVARLRTEVKRLKSFSNKRSSQKTNSVDRLSGQMRGWFETLGYSFESHNISDRDSFEWVIRIPARRGFDRILVRGIEGEAEIGDVSDLREAVDKVKTTEGWLVTGHRVSQAAREAVERNENHQQLFCYTFDELIDVNADFSGYLQWLESEVQLRGIDKMYVPLACTKEELEPVTKERIGISRYDERNGWVDGYIDRWLADPTSQHISILGEFGTGKTWFALHYAWKALLQYQDAKKRGIKRPRLPLVISLRDYAKAVTVESLFSEFFFRKHEIPLPGYSAFEQLNRMGKLLLIFDGFDEMADRVDRQKMIDNFWKLAQVVVPEAKAILTCRTEHFPEATEGRALLNAELKASTAALTGRPPQFEVLELEKFDDFQIRKVLSFRTTPGTIELIFGNPRLLDLARRPVMTELILEALPEIEAGKPIDLSRVYLYAVGRKMERDIRAERTFTSLADKLYFLCELSWEMLSTNQMKLNYRLFPERLSRLFGPAVREQKDMDHWRYDMMAQTMLIRNADGDYAPAHRSLLEFFVAYKFAAELGVLAPDFVEVARKQSPIDSKASAQNYTWSSYFRRAVDENGVIQEVAPISEFDSEAMDRLVTTVGREPLTEAVLDLLKNMLTPNIATLKSRLVTILERTRDEGAKAVGVCGGNIATLLVRLEPTIFKGQNLSRLNLNSASFAYADLTGCNMSGADLQNAYFHNSVLAKADLRNADLTKVRFDEMGAIRSVSLNPEGSLLATGGDDTSVHIWALRSGKEEFTLKRPLNEEVSGGPRFINTVCWGDNDLVGSAAEDREVILWNRASGEVVLRIPEAFSHWAMGLALAPGGDKLAVAGGMAEGAIKVWSVSSEKEMWSYTFNPSQTNKVIFSSDGKMLAASAWDRRFGAPSQRKAEVNIKNALLVGADGQNPWIIENTFVEGTWGIAFSPDDKRLFIGDFAGNIFVYDIQNKSLQTVINVHSKISEGSIEERVWSIETNAKNNLLAAFSDMKITFWDLSSLKRLIQINVGHAQRPTHGGGFSGRFGGDIVFDPEGTLLVGGFYDRSVRLWDARPFVTQRAPGIDIIKSSPPDIVGISEDPNTWPDWCQACKIELPQGMIPNPDFGKLLQIIEQEISYKGLQISGAKGLSAKSFTRDEEGMQTLKEWLVRKGAVWSTSKRKQVSKKK